MITVQTFQAKVAPKLHGTTIAKLSGSFYDKLHEAAGNLLSNVKPYSVIRSARIENAIYDRVYNYACQDDLEADSVIDIRPIGERATSDSLEGSFAKQFDIKKKYNTFNVEYVNGQKTLRLSKNLTPRTVLARLDSLTLEGTLTLGGDASNASIDTLDYISGIGALKFDLSGSTGSATIQLDLNNAIDLSDLLSVGALFEWLKFPDVSRLTSVKLEWGSSSSAYWYSTETAAHDRSFANVGDNGWMLIRHDWSDASSSGSPDEDDAEIIDYLKITITYTAGASISNVKMDNITAALGEAWEVVYYSNRLFTDTTGETWKEIPTALTDIIRLESGTDLNVFTYEFMALLGQELKGKDAAADMRSFKEMLGNPEQENSLYGQLTRKYPNQAVVRSIDYYEFGELNGEGD